MRLLKNATVVFDKTVSVLAVLAGSLLVFVMLSTNLGVVARYIFHQPLLWVIEFTGYSLLFMTFLGAAWLLRRERHIMVDIVVDRLKPKAQTVIGTITSILCTLVFLVICWYGAKVVWTHFQKGTFDSTMVIQFPDAYVLAIIPIGSFFLFVQSIRRTWGYLRQWRSSPKP